MGGPLVKRPRSNQLPDRTSVTVSPTVSFAARLVSVQNSKPKKPQISQPTISACPTPPTPGTSLPGTRRTRVPGYPGYTCTR
eukprot:2157946-Rhodomonas_salina.1